MIAVAPARAATVIPMSLEQLGANSQTIVLAETLSTECRFAGADNDWGGGKGTIETVVRLKVLEAAKGSPGDYLTVVVPGGTVGDLTFSLDCAPTFSVGETAILFLDDSGQVVGGSQGKMNVVNGEVLSLKKPVMEVLGETAPDARATMTSSSAARKAPVNFASDSQAPVAAPVMENLTLFSEGFETGMGNWSRDRQPDVGPDQLSCLWRVVLRLLRGQFRLGSRALSVQHRSLDGRRSVQSFDGYIGHAGLLPVPGLRVRLRRRLGNGFLRWNELLWNGMDRKQLWLDLPVSRICRRSWANQLFGSRSYSSRMEATTTKAHMLTTFP